MYVLSVNQVSSSYNHALIFAFGLKSEVCKKLNTILKKLLDIYPCFYYLKLATFCIITFCFGNEQS